LDVYLNKELSWLEFNARVLEEALVSDVPIAERLKFLSIFTSNLDEFFMVRVAGLKKMEQEGFRSSDSPDAMDVTQVLQHVRARVCALLEAQYRCLSGVVLPALEAENVKLLSMQQVSPSQKAALDDFFDEEVSPVLTPLGVDPAHPFPFLVNQSLYLVVVPKADHKVSADGVLGVGFVEVPSVLPRLIALKSDQPGEQCFVLLEDLIASNLESLFFGFQMEAAYPVRVTRNLDYNLLENKVVDLLKSIQREMVNREHQEVVRLEADANLPDPYVELLKQKLGVTDSDIYKLPRPMYISGLMDLYRHAPEHLKDPPFNPRLPPGLASSDDIFSVIAKQDLLVHHPYESFYAVTEFLSSAAHDPNVLAIKLTLYRSAGDSPIIEALIAAAENGKQVTAVVELKARFDERNNILWARRLERAGVNVVFGFVGLKTHGKMTLVVRRERGKLVRYVHVSTGNYNSSTAKLYTDIGLFTTDEAVGRDIATIFNLITGFDVLTGANRLKEEAIVGRLEKLFIAPVNMRKEILRLIKQEAEHAKRSGQGFIRAKMNALVDKAIIDAIYDASRAGVKIQLIVRGICSLRPGVPGLSSNIEVISIVDRFLEHSRVWHFHAGGENKVYISSADWMQRNMDRRIEIAIPVDNPNVKNRLVNEILQTCWMDDAKARILQPDGSYVRRLPPAGKEPLRAQQRFIDIAREGGIQSMPYEIAIRHKPKLKGERPIMKKKEKKEKDKDRERDREKRPDANVALMASAAVAAAAAAANPPAAALPALPPAATPAPLVGGTSAAPQRPSPATPSERLLSAVVENGPDGSDEGS
jgi:polyphosphate kinase